MKSTHTPSSERGIALIVVLLLMAVLSGLATGFAMTGNVEVQMGTNEVHFAGARAAAEAGLNRAIVEILADTSTNWLAGQDGAVDLGNPSAGVNADNGSIAFLLGGAGPYPLGTSGQFTYTIEILDDDNPELYESPLDPTNVTTRMLENNNPFSNINDRLILRATGFGPRGTVVRIARVLDTVDTTTVSSTTTTLSNPAILVNGDFEMDGTITVQGTSGHVHANGNLSKTGASGTVTGNATATGTADFGSWTPGGSSGGGRPTINVPSISAANFESHADYKLTLVGGVPVVQTGGPGNWTTCTTTACNNVGWSYSGGIWNAGSSPTLATYYIEGNVDIGPTSGSANRAISVIATGDINVHGSAELTPENDAMIQFVSDGDVRIVNGSDLDADSTTIEGQIMVRGQFEAGGNMEFQGRVLVQDVQSVGNLVENGDNRIHGTVQFTYNGSLGAITTTTFIPGVTTYVNNVSGWIEQ